MGFLGSTKGTLIMVFDTETTGLPPCTWNMGKRVMVDPMLHEQWRTCRIVQIAWSLHMEDGVCIERECHVIKPSGFTIPEASTRVHGITNREAEMDGIEATTVYERFLQAVQRSRTLVAHNIDFDINVVHSELSRYGFQDGVKKLLSLPAHCTMKMNTSHGQKWPKLAELYERLFKEKPSISHRADADVKQCARIYFHLSDHAN